MNAVFERLRATVADHFMIDPARLGAHSTAADVPGWDSVSQVMLQMQIEDTFAISLAPGVMDETADLGALAALIAATQAEPG